MYQALGLTLDEAVLKQYEALPVGATPQSIQDAALIARNDEDVDVLARAFTGDRQGYANTGQTLDAQEMVAAAQDSHLAVNDDGEAIIASQLRQAWSYS